MPKDVKKKLWRDSAGGHAFIRMAQSYRCGQCKKEFDKPWVVPTGESFPNNIQPNVEIAFHWEDTHGFPHDMFYEMVMNSMFKPEMTKEKLT